MKNIYFLLIVLFCLGGEKTDAQYTVIHYFNGPNGCQPGAGSPTLLGKTLFGITGSGGVNGEGCIFSIDTDGSGYKDIFDFNGANGQVPWGALTLLGTKLYGMTQSGGANNDGCIFSIDTNGREYKDLFDFNGKNGKTPYGSLTPSGGKLYGVTTEGSGSGNGNGNIFCIDTDGSGFKDMYDFDGSIGCNPKGSLTLSGNKLYGTTSQCATNHDGCIFSIDTNGKGCKDIFDFPGPSSPPYPGGPICTLTLSGSKLFGSVATLGKYDYGYIFYIDTGGVGVKDIFDFNYPISGPPSGDLILSGRIIYSMGGGGLGHYGGGYIFSIDTNGAGYKDMYDFKLDTTGYDPYGSLTLGANMLYGMAPVNELSGTVGVLFKINTSNISPFNAINELSATGGGIKVVPNPSNGVFNLEISNHEPEGIYMIEIYNLFGEEVYSIQSPTPKALINIDISNQPSGVYFYRILTATAGGLISQGKIVIQK